MTRKMSFRSAVVLVSATAAAVAMTGAAYAYMASSGSGSGSATTANGLTSFSTTATVASGALLYPGGTAPLSAAVDNSGNDYSLLVTSVALDSSRNVSVDVAHAASCTSPALSVSTPGTWAGISVGPDATSGAVNIPDAVSMGLDASNGCQGATFTIPVILTGRNA